MNWLAALNRPWLHFLLLGLLLFQVQSLLFPDPKTVIGPISGARILAIEERWQASSGVELTPEIRARLINNELNNDLLLQRALELEIHLSDRIVQQRLLLNMRFLNLAEQGTDEELFASAIDMGLHLDDPVVKRRLVQVVERLLAVSNPPAEPMGEELAREFEHRFDELRHPPVYSFEHIFFSADRSGETDSLVTSIKNENLSLEEARPLGSPFIQGRIFSELTPNQLIQNFGQEFVLELLEQDATERSWLGPIDSAFGTHLLWITGFQPARDAELSEVKEKLREDLTYSAKSEALSAAISELRGEYEVLGYQAEADQ